MRILGRLSSPVLVVAAVAAAVAGNLVIYASGRAAGAGFDFTSASGPAHVDPLTLIGFTAFPLAIGLILTAVVGRWWLGIYPIAMVVAPVLELGSILGMTVPSDHDLVAKITLGLCHVALVPVTLVALAALRLRHRAVHLDALDGSRAAAVPN